MPGSSRQVPLQRSGKACIAAWTRERFALPADAAVAVSQIACDIPGGPPQETVVAFWTEGARFHHFKVFKPIAEIEADDLPYAWQKDALAVSPGEGCDCC